MQLISRPWIAAAVGGVVCLLGACSQDGGSADDVRAVKTVRVRAAVGATIVVSEAESPALAGTALTIAPNALARDVDVSVALGLASIVEGADAAGPVAVWRPGGTRFAPAATMSLPYRLPAGRLARGLFVQVREDDGRRHKIEPPTLVVDEQAGVVRVPVAGFSSFQVGVAAVSGPVDPAPVDAAQPVVDAGADTTSAIDARDGAGPDLAADGTPDAPPPDGPSDTAPPPVDTGGDTRPGPTACPAPGGPRPTAPVIPNGGFDDGTAGWVAQGGCVTVVDDDAHHGRAAQIACSTGRLFQFVEVDPSAAASLRLRVDVRGEGNPRARLRVSTGCPPSYDQTVIGEHVFEATKIYGSPSAIYIDPGVVEEERLDGKTVSIAPYWVAYTSEDLKPRLPAGPHVLRLDLARDNGAVRFDRAAFVVDDRAIPSVVIEATYGADANPLPIEFVARCTDADGTCGSFEWTFGHDGSMGTATGPSVSRTVPFMNFPRSYKVAVRAQDDKGAARTAIREFYIPTPTTSIEVAPKPGSGVAPLGVTFDVRARPTGYVKRITYDYGDGESRTVEFDPKLPSWVPFLYPFIPPHTYTKPGVYKPALTVVTYEGKTLTHSPNPIAVYGPFMPSVTATPLSGAAPLTVRFAATASSPNGTIASYAWQFGDGTTSAEASPSHVFMTPGTYEVKLTVVDNVNISGTASVIILVR